MAEVKAEYQQKISEYPDEDYPPEIIRLIWKQFGLIHQIIQTLDDIEQGVLDVAKHKIIAPHSDDVIEIRSSPKAMNGRTKLDYIESFHRGLERVQKESSINAQVYGLISLDRNLATFADAQTYIKWIKHSKTNLICGLDISGNPSDDPEGKKRTLSGDALRKTINFALDSGIGIALHMGEVQTEQEQKDINTQLDTLLEWQRLNPGKDVSKYIRLGHCIYLTPQQKQIIRALNLPVEVCPSCHSQLNWHRKGFSHPATTIYSELPAPIVSGTDDECIFNGASDEELSRTFSFFGKRDGYKKSEFASAQKQFSFLALKQLRDGQSSVFTRLSLLVGRAFS